MSVARSRAAPGAALRAALALTASLAAGCGGGPVLGLALPLSGEDAARARDVRAGVELALAESGRQDVTLLVEDTGGDSHRTVAVIQQLARAGATAVIGPLRDDEARSAALLSQAEGMPLVAPSALDERLTVGNEWAFRFGFTRQAAASSLASHARYVLDLGSLAVIVDLGRTESVATGAAFAGEFQRRRGRIVSELTYWGGADGRADRDLDGLLRDAVAAGAEGAFIPGASRDVVAMLQGTDAETLSRLVLIGMSEWDDDEVRQAAAGRVAGAYFASHFATDELDGPGAAFAGRYRQRTGREASGHAALGYDVGRTVLEAFGDDATRTRVRSRLALVRRSQGATGKVSMDAHGSAVHRRLVLQQCHDPAAPRFVARLPD